MDMSWPTTLVSWDDGDTKKTKIWKRKTTLGETSWRTAEKSTLKSDLRSIREQLGFGGEILKLSRGSNESFSWDFYSRCSEANYVPVRLLVSQGCPTSGPEFCTVLLLSCPSELWDLRCRRFYCFRAQLQGYSGIDLLPWRLIPFLQCGELIIVHLSA